MFRSIVGLKFIQGFEEFYTYFMENTHKFRAIYEAEEPYKVQLPGEFQSTFKNFDRMII